MQGTKLLALALVMGFGLGLVGGAASGFFGKAAFLSFNIQPSSNSQSDIQQYGLEVVSPAYLNLGNLTAGQTGNYTSQGVVQVYNNSTFTVKLEELETLHKDFSTFNVSLTLGGKQYYLSLENPITNVTLQRGNYTFTVQINYVVSNHPSGDHEQNLNILEFHSNYDDSPDNSNTSATDNSPDNSPDQ